MAQSSAIYSLTRKMYEANEVNTKENLKKLSPNNIEDNLDLSMVEFYSKQGFTYLFIEIVD